jgi:Phage integrase family
MSEILLLRWDWIDLPNRRVVWPDSKTGNMSKPIGVEACRLLARAPRYENSPYVCPSIYDHTQPLGRNTYALAWRRLLKRAGIPHVGTHGIRHRAATDIANSGVPAKVGMALTAHKTITMFMRYVHTEDDPVRCAADLVATRRQALVAVAQTTPNECVEITNSSSAAAHQPPTCDISQGRKRPALVTASGSATLPSSRRRSAVGDDSVILPAALP